MIPQTEVITEVVQERPDKTYKIDLQQMKLIGKTDGIEAMKQAIYKVLNTMRYEHIIYSWDYGFDVNGIIGQDERYVRASLERKIEDALLQDERVKSVSEFEFERVKDGLLVRFVVNSVFGKIEAKKAVKV